MTLRIYVCLCIFFALSVRAETTETYDSEWIEYQLDKAAGTHERQYAQRIDMYTNVLNCVKSNVLVRTPYDGANALFVTWAGLAEAYVHPHSSNLHVKGYAYGVNARQLGYDTGVVMDNPRRFADLLHVLALYREIHFEDKDMTLMYGEEAWQTWPYFTPDMIDVWRLKYMQNYYTPDVSIPLIEELTAGAPFIDEMFYRNCGWLHTLHKDYRGAFDIWLKGLRDADRDSNLYYHFHQMKQYIEHATLAELEDTQKLLHRNAARYPATMRRIRNVTQWLNLVDDAHLTHELALRRAELNGDEETVSNLLATAAMKWRRPLYARKRHDTNQLVRFYCTRIPRETWWWGYPSFSRLPDVDELINTGDVSTNMVRMYWDTLGTLYEKNTNRANAMNIPARREQLAEEWKLNN